MRYKATRHLWISTLILLVGMIWIMVHFPTDSLWYDETVNAYLATQPWSAIWEWSTEIDNQMPLDFVALKLWASGTGDSEFALRAFSALAGLMTLAGITELGRQIGQRWMVGWLAAVFLMLAGGFLYAVGEVRTYALSLALLTWSLVFFWRVWQAPRHVRLWHWIAYFLSTLLLLFTHYTAFIVLAVEGLVILVKVIQTRGQTLKMAIVTGAVLIIGVGWWWLALNGRDFNTGTSFAGTVELDYAFDIYRFFYAFGQKSYVESKTPLLNGLTALIVVAGLLWIISQRNKAGSWARGILVVGLTISPLLAMLFAVTQVEAKLSGRHVWMVWVGVSLLLANGVASVMYRLRWRPAQMAVIGLSLILPVSAYQNAQGLEDGFVGDFRGAFVMLDEHAEATDILVLRDGTLFTAAEYYESPIPYVGVPIANITDVNHPAEFHETIDALDAVITRDTTAIWVMSWQGTVMDPLYLGYAIPEYLSNGHMEIWLADAPLDATSTVGLRRYPLADDIHPTPLFEHIVAYLGILQVGIDGPSLLGFDTYPVVTSNPLPACGVIAHTWWWRGQMDYPGLMVSVRVLGPDNERLGIADQPLGNWGFEQDRWEPFSPVLSRVWVDVPCEVFRPGQTYLARLVVYDPQERVAHQTAELLTFEFSP